MSRTHHVRSGQLGSQRGRGGSWTVVRKPLEAWLGDWDWSQSDLPSVLA